MNKQKALALSQVSLMILSMFAFVNLISISSASSTTSLSQATSCCERTVSGATCINTDPASCNSAYSSAPTSCESTSYCETGTCYNPKEGNCVQNTPKSTCEADGGVWSKEDISQVPQCQLGCCVISDQAAFVSKTRCSRLSSFVGVQADYFTDVEDEFSCILLAQGSQMGACVYDQGPDRTCKFTSRQSCGGEESFLGLNETDSSGIKFYADVLCSADELGTNCEKQYRTACDAGKVYWQDSCGNKENIYSSNSEVSYNEGRVAEDDEVCSPVAGSKSCGNCDYLMGGICAEEDNNFGEAGVNHFCQATTCKDRDGNTRKNGESWCVYVGKIGSGADTVGSRHFREICLNGEVITEGCADYRNEVCIHDSLDNGFDVAACRVNLWQDCTSQEKKADCLNDDIRDCVWYSSVEGINFSDSRSYSRGTGSSPGPSNYGTTTGSGSSGFALMASVITGKAIVGSGTGTGEYDVDLTVIDTTTDRNESKDGTCVPKFPPGLQFWDSGSAQRQCAQASATCTVEWKRELGCGDLGLETCDWEIVGDPTCVDEDGKLEGDWVAQANQVCVAMGDCGGYINFQGKFTEDGYVAKTANGSEFRFSPNTINKINIMSLVGGLLSATGNAIFELVSRQTAEADARGVAHEARSTARQGNSIINQLGDLVTAPILRSKGWQKIYNLQREVNLIGNNYAKLKTENISLSNQYNSLSGAIEGANEYLSSLEEELSRQNTDLDAYTDKGVNPPASTAKEILRLEEEIRVIELQISSARSELSALEGLKNEAAKNLREYEASDEYDLLKSKEIELNKLKEERGFMGAAGDMIGGVLESAIRGIAIGELSVHLNDVFGGNERYDDSIFNAALYGFMTYGTIDSVFGPGGLNTPILRSKAFAITAGITAAYFAYIDAYEDTKTETITFECKPWQAPIGQNECDKCSDDDLPCSEYRCRSLGPTCGIVNEGTDQVECIDMSKNDAKGPIISPNSEVLSTGFTYSEISDYGFRIQSSEGECLPAFSSIQWGIRTSEPAQCKIDIRHTSSFEDMSYYIGGSNIYADSHTEYLAVPNSKDLENLSAGGIQIQNGNEMEVYIRCRDGNANANSGEGNVNDAEYAVKFCVDETPDVTPPQVVSSSVNTGSCVASDQDTAEVVFYTNEPASCRWDKQDRSDFSDMQYSMTCSRNAVDTGRLMVYPCTATFSGINSEDTPFYIRCQDEEGNDNDASYDFSLKGSLPLKMENLGPNSTIRSGADPAEVNLRAETSFGCEAGRAVCFYSQTGLENDFTMFKDTDTEDGVHTQKLYLQDGSHTISFKCVDAGGNVAENTTSFEVDVDTTAPEVVRVYEDNDLLKVVTVRDAICSFSTSGCDFLVDEGEKLLTATGKENVHMTEWVKDTNYYIKCKDNFNNEELGCSVVVRPVDNFL